MEKFTVITGACGGLGRAFVEILAKNKENLILTGTSEKKLNELMKDFKEKFVDIKVQTFVLDLAKKSDRENFIKFIQENHFEVNKLINNAGVIIEGDLERFSDEEISNAVEVNCVGTLDLTKKFLRIRNKENLFEVLTVASVASSYPIPHMAVYAATKAFLVSMMTSLAVEYKKQNGVFTAFGPGGVETRQAMKDSIKSMGLGGKLSTLPTIRVAKIGLRALKHKKRVVISGNFNKFLVAISKPTSKSFQATCTGKIWKKSQAKRNFWYVLIIFFEIGLTKSVI